MGTNRCFPVFPLEFWFFSDAHFFTVQTDEREGVFSEALKQLEHRDLVRYSLLGLLHLGPKLAGAKERLLFYVSFWRFCYVFLGFLKVWKELAKIEIEQKDSSKSKLISRHLQILDWNQTQTKIIRCQRSGFVVSDVSAECRCFRQMRWPDLLVCAFLVSGLRLVVNPCFFVSEKCKLENPPMVELRVFRARQSIGFPLAHIVPQWPLSQSSPDLPQADLEVVFVLEVNLTMWPWVMSTGDDCPMVRVLYNRFLGDFTEFTRLHSNGVDSCRRLSLDDKRQEIFTHSRVFLIYSYSQTRSKKYVCFPAIYSE